MSEGEPTELDNLIGSGKKKRGCCASHPILCSVSLLVILVLCVAGVICGTVFHPTVDRAVQDAIGEHVKLTNGSAATGQFVHSSAPIYTTYYLFNITNPDNVLKHHAKPNLKQMGPYAFRENRTAFNLQWLEKDTVLRYDTNITYTWDPYKSRGNDPDRDIVTTINVPLIVLFQTVEEMSNGTMFKILVKAIDWLKKESGWDGVFVKHTVSELLWGYTDPILARLHSLHHLASFIPDENPVFSFGNISTVETPNRVYTGVGNLSQVAQYIEWNGNTAMTGWNNTWASMINGTGGYSFHPGISRNETLMVFIDELFRSGYFKYDSDMLDHGITLYKFVLPDDELKNTTQAANGFPGNNPNGVLNLSPVVPANAPLFASKPHFLHADPVFRKNVTGLHPDPSLHDSYIGVEPITGGVMNAAKRIQVNLKLRRSSAIPELEYLPDNTMLPIYYAEQTGAVTTELANEFKNKVFTIRWGVLGALWAVVGVAGLVAVICVMCLAGVMVQQCRRRRNSIRQVQYAGF